MHGWRVGCDDIVSTESLQCHDNVIVHALATGARASGARAVARPVHGLLELSQKLS